MQKAMQPLPMSENRLPDKWKPRYILKRIGEENITISQETRNEILRQLAKSGKYIQIGEYTIMLSSIKSIDPFWKPNNIPPRPKKEIKAHFDDATNTATEEIVNQDEIDLWDRLFGKQQDSKMQLLLEGKKS